MFKNKLTDASIDDLFDESKLEKSNELFGNRKHVNLKPLDSDELKVACEKRKKILSQRRFIKELGLFTTFLVALFMINYTENTQLKYAYKASLDNLFNTFKNFSNVR